MNQTNNYQLNQWEKSDRIQMEDFNADNAKVDSALTELSNRSSLHFIKEYHFSEPGITVTLPLTDIDWTQWQAVVFDFDLESDQTNLTAEVTTNGDRGKMIGDCYIQNVATPAEERDDPSRIVLFCKGSATSPVHTMSFRKDYISFYAVPDRLNTVPQFYITNRVEGAFTTNSRVLIYGIR